MSKIIPSIEGAQPLLADGVVWNPALERVFWLSVHNGFYCTSPLRKPEDPLFEVVEIKLRERDGRRVRVSSLGGHPHSHLVVHGGPLSTNYAFSKLYSTRETAERAGRERTERYRLPILVAAAYAAAT